MSREQTMPAIAQNKGIFSNADAVAFYAMAVGGWTMRWIFLIGIVLGLARMIVIGVLAVVLVITALLFGLFHKTKVGLAMRAVANDPISARSVGVPTNQILMFSWALAALIGAIGGALKAGIDTNVSIGSMFSVFLLSAAAATLGGLDSPGGAVIGGLSLGVIESLVGNYPRNWPASDWIGIQTKTAVAFLIILIVLLVRPAGLFGSSRVERV